ncbi:hypothetical protein Hanom_Chr10g00887881 [Helianthus anomalus]
MFFMTKLPSILLGSMMTNGTWYTSHYGDRVFRRHNLKRRHHRW